MDSLDIKLLINPKPVSKRLRDIMADLEDSSTETKLNKDFLNRSLRQSLYDRIVHIAGSSIEQ